MAVTRRRVSIAKLCDKGNGGHGENASQRRNGATEKPIYSKPMRGLILSALLVSSSLIASTAADAPKHRNPIISLLEQHKPVFGVYAPSNGGRRGQPAPERPAI